MSYPSPLNPQRVNPGEDGYNELMIAWHENGKPRRLDLFGITWMQISDNQGVCYVPENPSNSGMGFYDQSSFGRIHR